MQRKSSNHDFKNIYTDKCIQKETYMCPGMYVVVNVNTCILALCAVTTQLNEHTENPVSNERSWELVGTRIRTGEIGSCDAGKEGNANRTTQ